MGTRVWFLPTLHRPDALHSPSDAVVAVIGMDLTLGYFYKLLTVNMDVCEQDKIA